MQPTNTEQWSLRYLMSEAIRNGAKLSLDSNGNVMVQDAYGKWSLLSEQSASREVLDGKRRGFNGKQPRLHDGVSHPITVTTADGRSYVVTKRATRKVDTPSKDVQALIRTLAPSNGGNPDA